MIDDTNHPNPLDLYMVDVRSHELLTREDEQELFIRIEMGDEAARERIIHSNLRLVFAIAKRYRRSGVQYTDLIQEGNIGLMRAVEKFDYRKGHRFSTYATWWIRQACQRYTHENGHPIRLPEYRNADVLRIRQAVKTVQEETGEQASISDVASRMGMRLSDAVAIWRAIESPVRLDREAKEDGAERIVDRLPSPDPSPVEIGEAIERAERVREAMRTMSPREQSVLRLRFGLDGRPPMSLRDAGAVLGCTRERVRQIQELALDKLRMRLRNDPRLSRE